MKNFLLFSLTTIVLFAGCFDRATNAQQNKEFQVSEITSAQDVYPAIVLGGGIAGLTAANYLAQANIPCVIIEGGKPGGALAQSDSVRNWPGVIESTGNEIVKKLKQQTLINGVIIEQERVVSVDFNQWPYLIKVQKLDSNEERTLKTLSCIIAIGAEPNYLGIPGEQKFWGKGVTNCAVCDGALYKGKKVAIVGGGDSALVEAAYLASIAQHVTILVRGDSFRAHDKKKLQEIMNRSNISIMFKTEVTAVNGTNSKVDHLAIKNNLTQECSTLEIDGLFLAIGAKPNTTIVKSYLKLDDAGYLIVDHNQQTNLKGIFAAGDIADPHFKQAITSAAQGCIAALKTQEFLADCNYKAENRPLETRNSLQIAHEEIYLNNSKNDTEIALEEIITRDQFKLMLQNNQHLLIDAYAQLCIPCEQLVPILLQAKEKFEDTIKIAKFDLSNENDDLSINEILTMINGQEITSAPTLLFIKEGKEIGRIDSPTNKDHLFSLIQKHFDIAS